MSTLVTGVSLGAFEQLPTHARQCTFWVMDPVATDDASVPAAHFSDPEFENEAWLSMVMLEWGPCGQLLSVEGTAVGCALYAPPGAVPRSTLFPTSPVSPDAVLLTTLHVESDMDNGHHATLIQAVVADLVNRGVRALEAFGIRSSPDDALKDDAVAGSRTPAAQRCSPTSCMVDADFLEKVGFEVIQPHHRFPRMRLELDRDHGWKEDVESALERLLIEASVSLLEIDHRVPAGVR